jgi:hypothetical protein
MKKLSIITAVLVAMTTLVAAPAANANAGLVTLTVAGSAATGGTVVTTPVSLPVPADNSIDAADALKIAVTAVDTGTVVTAVAVNATIVPALTGTTVVTASSGTSTLSVSTGTGNSADFYVYTKSTAVGSVSITRAGTTTVYYVQGSNSAATANSITLSAPTSGAAGTSQVLKVSAFDVFGNPKSGVTVNTLVSANGIATATPLLTDTATATIGTKEQTVTLPASGSVTVTAYATVATAVTGLAAPVGSVVATIVVRDLAAELAAKNAELAVANAALAAEKAGRAADKVAADKALADAKALSDSATVTAKAASDLAAATAAAKYKAEYNALATKWNKKFPKLKVALKK